MHETRQTHLNAPPAPSTLAAEEGAGGEDASKKETLPERTLTPRDNARNLGFTRRRQCRPCDFNRLRNSLGDFGARLCGVVSCPKRERENGLPTFIEDIKAKAQVRHPRDFAHGAVRVDEARHVFVS
jgi:hypothetical protein